uniref:Uncharacterized protein n=1 Tax=Chenopodium quinoa TaxID=63459 RepID=A0A803KTX1_CHEQI
MFKVANIIFLDSPVGAGFSYATNNAYLPGDTNTAKQAYEFLKKSAKGSCHGDYRPIAAKGNAQCKKSLETASKCIVPLENEFVLESKCFHPSPDKWCLQYYHGRMSELWANNINVQKALYVREGTINQWIRCRGHNNDEFNYTHDIDSSVSFHQNLSMHPFRALIFSGDQDICMPYMFTLKWMKKLNVVPNDVYWSPWFLYGQVAGCVTEYSNDIYNLTFTTIKVTRGPLESAEKDQEH